MTAATSSSNRWPPTSSPADTNQLRDVFLRDRPERHDDAAQRRRPAGRKATAPRSGPSISDDGTRVAFLSDATTLDATPDPLPCDPTVLACTRVFVRTVLERDDDPAGYSRSRFQACPASTTQHHRVSAAVVSGDGLTVDRSSSTASSTSARHRRTASEAFGQLLVGAGSARSSSSCPPSCRPCGLPRLSNLAVDAAGRVLACCADGAMPPPFLLLCSTCRPG